MLNQSSILAVDNSKFSASFVKPLVSTYCFCNIVGTIGSALSAPWRTPLPGDVLGDLAKSYEHVVFIFVDAFGWRFLDQARQVSRLVAETFSKGVVSKLTAQFPSTTAAEVTTLHTGLPVNEHGIYEWFMYEPNLDLMLAPLMFSRVGDATRNTLSGAGVDPTKVYASSPWYAHLYEHGVTTHLYLDETFAYSPYNATIAHQAVAHGFPDIRNGLGMLREELCNAKTQTYHYFYCDDLDGAAHHAGPTSPESAAALVDIFSALDDWREALAARSHGDTLLLLGADHGSVEMDPCKTVYLDSLIPSLEAQIERSPSGLLKVPTGSPRDFFLHIRAQERESVRAMLKERLHAVAEVYATDDLIAQGLFGVPETTSARLRARVADTVVLPYKGESVFWLGDGRYRKNYLGNHGGLSPEEMEVPFLALEV